MSPTMSNNVRLPLLDSLTAELGEGQALSALSAATASATTSGGSVAIMQVGDLARESGKTVRAIHLYEELSLLKPTSRSKGGYRLYSAEALVPEGNLVASNYSDQLSDLPDASESDLQ